MSEWKNIKTEPPTTIDDVIVTDGLDSYAIAWFRLSDKTWHPSIDLLHNTGGFISLDLDLTEWKDIN